MDEIKVCKSKKQIKSENEAKYIAKKLTQRRGVIFSYYECDVCYFYHLRSGAHVGTTSRKTWIT